MAKAEVTGNNQFILVFIAPSTKKKNYHFYKIL